jgi:hypothetical protein
MLMKQEKQVDLLIPGVPALAFLILLLVSQVNFGVALSPQEKSLLEFRGESMPQMVYRKPSTPGMVSSPVPLVVASEKDFPRELLGDLAPAEDGTPSQQPALSVSLIVVGRGKKFAIISGIVTKEGDIVDRQKVVRIERDKVLLRDNEGERWLRLD